MKLLKKTVHASSRGKTVKIEVICGCCCASAESHPREQTDVTPLRPLTTEQMLQEMAKAGVEVSGGINPHERLRHLADLVRLNRGAHSKSQKFSPYHLPP